MRKPLFIKIISLINILFFCGFFQPEAVVGQKQDTQIVISSERVDLDNQKKEALYYGGVKVVKGDMVILSDNLRVVFQEKGEGVREIEAKGMVKFFWQERRAEAEEALYNAENHTLILSGSPKIWHGENMLQGESIVYELDDDKVFIRGGVKTTLFIEKDEKLND